MLQNLIDSLEYTIKSSKSLLKKEEIIAENIANLKEQVKKQEEYFTFIKGAKEKYRVAVNELYEESNFVFFAVDYVNEIEELETLLDSKNETLVLKVLTLLKEKSLIQQSHKDLALTKVFNSDLRKVIEVL